jgi:hypothetical protein
MGPSNANAGRGEWFRANMKRPQTIAGMVLGAAVGLLAGAYWGGPAGAAAAPIAVLIVIAGAAWWLADRRAETIFWQHVASSLGYEPFYDPTALETTTPLLHAGDRRSWRHELIGPLGDTGLKARLAQYRYEVRHENDKGEERWTPYEFTVTLVELPESMQMFPGIYLRERRGVLERIGHHDWLRGRRLRDAELESTELTEEYRLQVAPEQDEGRLRELFDPKTIVWFAEHPLRPQIELRAGFLVVYVPGWLEDLGRLVWLLEATERMTERVQAELAEAARSVG